VPKGVSSRASLALLALSPLLGCASGGVREPATVRVGGSDTMGVLLRRWAEEFMRRHPGVVVETSGGGSGRGIDRLIDAELDVAAASRPMLPGEVRRLHERHGVLGVGYRCARDALSVYLNPANPVQELSLDELRGVYAGRIRNWRELGGAEARIEPLGRPPASGTHRLFRDLVLETDAFDGAVVALPTTDAICARVGARPAAIGYGGVAFGSELLHARIDGVAPTAENVRRGVYPLGRYLYLVTTRPPAGVVRRFVDWCLSPDGQRLVEKVGYAALWS
jgi:phosphate transport system substrate-binding protein